MLSQDMSGLIISPYLKIPAEPKMMVIFFLDIYPVMLQGYLSGVGIIPYVLGMASL